MRLITLCALLALSIPSSAQYRGRGERESVSGGELYFSDRVFLKFTPNTIFDDKGGLLPVSVEYTFAETWGLQVDLGVPLFTTLTRKHQEKQIMSDFRVGVAAKHYFVSGSNARGFLALEGLYRRQQSKWGSGTYSMYDTHVRFSSANSVMQSKIISAIVGASVLITPKLFFEPQAGFGVNFSENTWTDVKETGRFDAYVFAPGTDEDHKIGKSTRLYLPWRVTLSILLGRGNQRFRW